MDKKITMEEKTKKPYTLKVYRGHKKTERKYWKTLGFSNFKKFEEFILKLFEKGYQINKIVDTSQVLTHIYAPSNPSLGLDLAGIPDRKEIWFCSKKEEKCYVFIEPENDEGKNLYLFLVSYFPLNKTLDKKR